MKAGARLALGLVLSVVAPAAALDITACDQEVPAGQVGVLTADLDCGSPAPGSYGVEIERNAILDLQGHTIAGAQWAVYCRDRGRCTVTSTTGGKGTLTAAEAGIWGPTAKIYASNVRIADNAYGISNNPKTTLADVDFADNGFALTARSLRASNTTHSVGSPGTELEFAL